MSEKRQIVAGSMLIYHAIYSQAGKLEKAILECVMNSVDAEASKIEITVDNEKYEVKDDGVGLSRMEEIESFFEELGFDHSGDNYREGRQFAEFGLGRAQCFAFSRTIWRTGTYSMDVDVKHKGLDYELEKDLEPVSGCTITGHLYNELLPSEREKTVRALDELVKYMPIPVYINGKQVNKVASEQNWHLQDDNAYYRLTERGELTVYNLGAKVCALPSSHFGTGGVIVSKKALKLNTARTEVLESVCPVWPEIKQVVKANVKKESTEKKTRMTEARREFLAMQLVDGDIGLRELMETKLVTDVCGRHHPLSRLFSEQTFTVAPKANHNVGERLHKSGVIFVISPVTVQRFGFDDGEDLANLLNTKSVYGESCQFEGFEAHAANINDKSDLVPLKELDPIEKAALLALRRANEHYPRLFARATGDRRRPRELKAGASEVANAWTDGKRYIAIERRHLKKANKGLIGFVYLANLILHEYCHEDSSVNAPGHSQEFYEVYEAVATFTDEHGYDGLGKVTEAAMKAYIKEIDKANKKLTKMNLEHHDRQRQIEKKAGQLQMAFA